MVEGIVVHGDGFGKSLGYPTANIEVSKKTIGLARGVYAAWADLERIRYQAAFVVNDDPWKLEVFLFTYHGPDFYGKHLVVFPIQKVSEIEPYENIEALKNKISQDIILISDFFVDKKVEDKQV